MQKNTRNGFVWAAFFTTLALFTFANGVLCFAFNLCILLLQKRKRQGIVWILFTTMLLCFYFLFGYHHPDHLPISISNFGKTFLYSLVFLGNSTQFLYKEFLPYVTGVVIWLMLIYISYKKYFLKNPVIYFVLLFIVASSLLAGLFRSAGNYPTSQPLQTTYGIYSIVAICCCFIFFIEEFSEKKIIINRLFGIAVLYNLLCALFFFPENSYRKEYLSNCIYPWLLDEKEFVPYDCTWSFDPLLKQSEKDKQTLKAKQYKEIINRAKELGTFTPRL